MGEENKKLSEFAEEIKLFGKWKYNLEFNKDDTSLKDQMHWKPRWYPHSAGRWQKKRFRKIQCPIVERLTNCLMMHGRNSGKKIKACNIVKRALEIIAVMKGNETNPLQVLLQALENGGPREDSTRVGSGGCAKTSCRCFASNTSQSGDVFDCGRIQKGRIQKH